MGQPFRTFGGDCEMNGLLALMVGHQVHYRFGWCSTKRNEPPTTPTPLFQECTSEGRHTVPVDISFRYNSFLNISISIDLFIGHTHTHSTGSNNVPCLSIGTVCSIFTTFQPNSTLLSRTAVNRHFSHIWTFLR